MSSFQQKNLRGALFRNERKRDGRQDPDYQGSCMLDNKEFWTDGWVDTAKDGKKYLSLSFRPKMAREQGAPANPPAQKAEAPKDDFDDSIPF